MKTLWILLALASLLCGWTSEETLETISDDIVQPVMAQPGEISVRLPDNAVAPVLESDSEQVYLSEDYEIIVETVSGGDLSATIQRISGYTPDNLTVMETAQDGAKRYDFVWASAGENGDQLGRAVILDDGNYHYCLSVLRDADTTEKSQIVWRTCLTHSSWSRYCFAASRHIWTQASATLWGYKIFALPPKPMTQLRNMGDTATLTVKTK